MTEKDKVELMRRFEPFGREIPKDQVMSVIARVPTTDRPKGEWIHTPNGIDRDFVWWTCSECGHKIFSETEKDRIEFHAYCGRCGAYMRGDTERC